MVGCFHSLEVWVFNKFCSPSSHYWQDLFKAANSAIPFWVIQPSLYSICMRFQMPNWKTQASSLPCPSLLPFLPLLHLPHLPPLRHPCLPLSFPTVTSWDQGSTTLGLDYCSTLPSCGWRPQQVTLPPKALPWTDAQEMKAPNPHHHPTPSLAIIPHSLPQSHIPNSFLSLSKCTYCAFCLQHHPHFGTFLHLPNAHSLEVSA